MKKLALNLTIMLFLNLLFSFCTRTHISDYPIKPVSLTKVKLTDDFWSNKINRNLEITIPYVLNQMKVKGGFESSGTSKVIEGISYYLMMNENMELEALADTLISYIRARQQEDGFIGRIRSNSDGSALSDSARWLGTDDFGETGGSPYLYGAGHMYEAAVAYYEATGKRSLLDIAEKNARLLLSVFGPDKLISYPFHPEIELALVKLYRATGNLEYLKLSKFFLDARGPNGTEYSQSHQKIIDQREATGHAVRALYLYSGITDIVALTNDKHYKEAIDAIWESVIDSKFYITGGVGSAPDHEAIGKPFSLPNLTAYNETCASIANIFWSYRMFMMNGDASYIDVLERTLYNTLLDGISITGNRFFYANPLASNSQYQRASWYGVPCCPPNIIRFLPQIPGYIYAFKGNDLFVNLFIDNSSEIELTNGKIGISQETGYPWNGNIKIMINPLENRGFTLRIRIPGWANEKPVPSDLYNFMDVSSKKVILTLNGKPYSYQMEKGFAVIKRNWSDGDVVALELPMEARKIMANYKVEDDRGRFAIQRGPVVYCLEGPDNENGPVNNILIPEKAKFELGKKEDFIDGAFILTTTGYSYTEQQNNPVLERKELKVTAIPYYLWANRGPSGMTVWIPFEESAVTPRPDPLPTIASKSSIISSCESKKISCINDLAIIPYNQNIPMINYFRWPVEDTINWVQYIFAGPETVSSTKVYWYDNEPSRMTTWYDDVPWTCCRVPESWEILYLDNDNSWHPVKALNGYGTEKYMYNEVKFEAVSTRSLKMVVKKHGSCTSGLQEWIVN